MFKTTFEHFTNIETTVSFPFNWITCRFQGTHWHYRGDWHEQNEKEKESKRNVANIWRKCAPSKYRALIHNTKLHTDSVMYADCGCGTGIDAKANSQNEGVINDIAVFTLWISAHSITKIMVRYFGLKAWMNAADWNGMKTNISNTRVESPLRYCKQAQNGAEFYVGYIDRLGRCARAR